METSHNTTKLAQHNGNKPQHNGNKPQHNKISTTQRNKPQHNKISTTQRKQATTQQN